jgi:hypothetical protein
MNASRINGRRSSIPAGTKVVNVRLIANIFRSLQPDMRAELRNLERAAAAGTREAGRGLRTELRRQVTSAGLG